MTEAVAMHGVMPSEMRRNALILSAASAIIGAIPAVLFTLGGLTGLYLLGADKSLATVPITGYTVGLALGTVPAAALMRASGRRFGFLSGACVNILAGLMAGAAVIVGSFIFFVIAMAVAGFANAFAQQYRFAAGDGGDPAARARAISWVLSGGIASAIIGPQTVIFTRNLLQPIPFAGAFFATSVLGVIGFVVLSFLGGPARVRAAVTEHAGGRPLSEIARQPRFLVAVFCAMGAYALMNLVMTAAPLAMVACGLGEDNAALGIQWHALAMYGPSFFTGKLIARFGKTSIVATGLLLLAGCAVVALTGVNVGNFWLSLILLGAGWNFAFIGATAMLTETYRPEEKAKVEGLNDFLVFGSVAVASFSSGNLLNALGWQWINLMMFPILALCALALATTVMGRRRGVA